MVSGLLRRFAVNSSRVHLAEYNREFAARIPHGALVLDAGAGDAPYRHLLTHTQYESADFEQVDKPYAKSTYVCDLSRIPVDAGRFDHVMFNQVLEHLPEPKTVLRELHRVLKPGGTIICTAPLFYEEHEVPYDFYRYTQFGHQHLFAESGFRIDRIEWMEGYLGTVAYQLDTAARYLPARPSAIAPGLRGYLLAPVMMAVKLMFSVMAIVFYQLDIAAPVKTRGYPKNYVVIATKTA